MFGACLVRRDRESDCVCWLTRFSFLFVRVLIRVNVTCTELFDFAKISRFARFCLLNTIVHLK